MNRELKETLLKGSMTWAIAVLALGAGNKRRQKMDSS
jgi:hypothetical protein